MLGVLAGQWLIRLPVVREDEGRGIHVGSNGSTKSRPPARRNDAKPHAPASLDHPENRRLVLAEVSGFGGRELPSRFPAPRSLVNLYVATERVVVLVVHQLRANLVEHSPCGLVS